MREANELFKHSLKKNTFAQKYLNNRRILSGSVNVFQIGYCPDDQTLINYFKKKNISDEELIKADLLIKNKNDNFFGRFRDRITFPIFNHQDKIVGFGGRTINNSKIKYINSQESEIFKKSEILFGLTQNINEIRESKEIILVEGYLDVISLHQRNIKCCLSPMGTTLSVNQLTKLWNLCDIPFICFDGDNAGRTASKNIAEKILEFLEPGKSFKFINLPESEDPDSFFKNNKVSDFDNLKKDSVDLSDLIWEIIIGSFNEFTPELLAKVDETIKLYSNKIKNKSVSSEYFKYLKDKKNKFLWEMNVIKKKKPFVNFLKKVEENINEKLVIVYAIFEIDIFISMIEEVSKLNFRNSNLDKIINDTIEVVTNDSSSVDYKKKYLKNKYSQIFNSLSRLYETHLKKLENIEKINFFKQIINNLKLPDLSNEKEIIKKKILECTNTAEQNKLIHQYDKLISEIKSIKKKILNNIHSLFI